MSVCRVLIDGSRCSAIGLCEAEVPEVFRLDSDGALRILMAEVPIAQCQQLEEAALTCPTQAISVQVVQ